MISPKTHKTHRYLNSFEEFQQKYKQDYNQNIIGRGGFGSVYRIQENQSGKCYALKIITNEHDDNGENDDGYYKTEIENIFQIQDLNAQYLVQTLEAFEDYQKNLKIAYIIMELAECDLQNYVKCNKKLSNEQLWNLFKTMISASMSLKQHGIFHRDLKPANVFIFPEQSSKNISFKLGDFGSATRNLVIKDIYTTRSHIPGTEAFLSPELKLILSQIENGEKVKCQLNLEKSEIWAIGLVVLIAATQFQLKNFKKNMTLKIKQIKNLIDQLQDKELKEIITFLMIENPENRSTYEFSMNRIQMSIQEEIINSGEDQKEQQNLKDYLKLISKLQFLPEIKQIFTKILKNGKQSIESFLSDVYKKGDFCYKIGEVLDMNKFQKYTQQISIFFDTLDRVLNKKTNIQEEPQYYRDMIAENKQSICNMMEQLIEFQSQYNRCWPLSYNIMSLLKFIDYKIMLYNLTNINENSQFIEILNTTHQIQEREEMCQKFINYSVALPFTRYNPQQKKSLNQQLINYGSALEKILKEFNNPNINYQFQQKNHEQYKIFEDFSQLSQFDFKKQKVEQNEPLMLQLQTYNDNFNNFQHRIFYQIEGEKDQLSKLVKELQQNKKINNQEFVKEIENQIHHQLEHISSNRNQIIKKITQKHELQLGHMKQQLSNLSNLNEIRFLLMLEHPILIYFTKDYIISDHLEYLMQEFEKKNFRLDDEIHNFNNKGLLENQQMQQQSKEFIQQDLKENLEQNQLLEQIQSRMDFLIIIDATDSMQKWIDQCKQLLKNILDGIFNLNLKEIRVGIIGYRDRQDEKRIEILDFVSVDCDQNKNNPGMKKISDWLGNLKEKGGMDLPEDINYAFRVAISKFAWKNYQRIILHLSDAPCHGKDLGFNNLKDDYPQTIIEEDIEWKIIFEFLKMFQIDYIYIQLEKQNTELMVQKFQEIWKNTKVNKLDFFIYKQKEAQYIVKDMINSDPTQFLQLINDSTKSSISQSQLNKLSFNILYDQQVNKFRNQSVKQIFSWEKFKWQKDEQICKNAYMSLKKKKKLGNQVTSQISFQMTVQKLEQDFFKTKLIQNNAIKTEIQIENLWFDEGAEQYCYNVYFKESGQRFIIKKQKEKTLDEIKESVLKKTLLDYIVQILSNEYNKELINRAINNYHVNPIEKLILYAGEQGQINDDSGFIVVEKWIPNFQKIVNNNFELDTNQENQFYETFCHFSFIFTEGQLMVCDIQGNQNQMTDFAINTIDRFFESTDGGEDSMHKFFQKHSCNLLCKKLNLRWPEKWADYQKELPQEENYLKITSVIKKCKNTHCKEQLQENSNNDYCQDCLENQ